MTELFKIIKKIKKIKNNIKILKRNLESLLNQKKKIKYSLLKNFSQKINIKKNKKFFFLQKTINEIEEWIEIFKKDKDPYILQEIKILYQNLKNNVHKIEKKFMFLQKDDKNNCYIDIQSGSGGLEAQDWTKILLRMYLRWAIKKNLKSYIIQETLGENSGIKSITLKIIGKYAFGWFRTESGIHRLVRKNPLNTNNRRHTSFSSVFVYPEIDKKINIKISLSDIKIDVYRASGAGGQHVNRTESAVRIKHLPTGLVTQCQNSRSQHQNKNSALKQLQSKLYEFEKKKKNIQKKNINKKKLDIRWGNQIRSYILDDSRIKDLQSGIETHNIQKILDGNLKIFIEKNLKNTTG
ncbi:peptide chain release factor 2 [Buchnera aphidicola]|uniref:peptide chain release factor 2 n=1 Tax=Buchnera aphidicola TaxID=9 RepID=UPI003D1886BC